MQTGGTPVPHSKLQTEAAKSKPHPLGWLNEIRKHSEAGIKRANDHVAPSSIRSNIFLQPKQYQEETGISIAQDSTRPPKRKNTKRTRLRPGADGKLNRLPQIQVKASNHGLSPLLTDHGGICLI